MSENQLREKISQALRSAIKSRDEVTIATLRLMLAAIKDREIVLRDQSGETTIQDQEIKALLRTMVKQRQESIAAYLKGKRDDLAEREQKEQAIINGFLPAQWDEVTSRKHIQAVLNELEAKTVKDMGRTMACLRERFPDLLNFSLAGKLVKQALLNNGKL